jgi:hypothetical protein
MEKPTGKYSQRTVWKEHHTVSITADAMVTRYFLPDSTLAILSKGATLEYDTDKYGKANREVNMSGKIYFSVRRNALSPFIVIGLIVASYVDKHNAKVKEESKTQRVYHIDSFPPEIQEILEKQFKLNEEKNLGSKE